MATFAPLGDSVVVAVTETDQRVALPALPASNPFLRLVAAQGNMLALYVKLGNGAVTGSVTTSVRVRPGSIADPLYIFVGAAETHLSIFCEGPPGNVTITAGKFMDSDPDSGFAPLGSSSDIAVTNTDQRAALPTLPASNPVIRLNAKQANMAALYIKLGNAAVTGSLATSMRIQPGSVDEPIYIGVGAGETHLSIFCEGMPGAVALAGGKFGTGDLAAGSVSYAQIQNVSASPRLLGRKTAGAGVIEEITLTEALDFGGGAAQGDILYRGAANWARLAASTAGRLLKTNGAGADPAWVAPPAWQVIEAGTASSVVNFDFSVAGFDEVDVWAFIRPATDGVRLQARFSQNGGSSFLTGATDYRWGAMVGDLRTESAGSGTNLIEVGGTTNTIGNAADEGYWFRAFLHRPNASGNSKTIHFKGQYCLTTGVIRAGMVGGQLILNTTAITDLQFFFSTGNVAEASFVSYGRTLS